MEGLTNHSGEGQVELLQPPMDADRAKKVSAIVVDETTQIVLCDPDIPESGWRLETIPEVIAA